MMSRLRSQMKRIATPASVTPCARRLAGLSLLIQPLQRSRVDIKFIGETRLEMAKSAMGASVPWAETNSAVPPLVRALQGECTQE